MVTAFAKLTFTPAVLELQQRFGSRRAYAPLLEEQADPGNRVGPAEAAFIAARDGFYQSTISETGWPYVQFKGGPRGFLKVIDDQSLAYADFTGNRQYLSAGNLTTNNKLAMILVDYPNRRRLKIWGTASLLAFEDEPNLIAKLHDPEYAAAPERAVVIKIDAMSWNCPQHLPERYTMDELKEQLNPVFQEIAALRAENSQLKLAQSSGSEKEIT